METSANLRSDVHLVAIDQDLVLLDIHQDRYICIPDGAQAISAAAAGRVRFLRPDAARLFREAGLLGNSDIELGRYEDGGAPPSRSWDRDPCLPDLSSGDIWRVILAIGDYYRHYCGRSFQAILAHAARHRRPGQPVLTDDLLLRVRQFHRAVVWAPIPGKCLARSFVMLSFLRRCGFDARWVIAARTWPFGAHCWLQVEDFVLDDFPERVAGFAPLCVV